MEYILITLGIVGVALLGLIAGLVVGIRTGGIAGKVPPQSTAAPAPPAAPVVPSPAEIRRAYRELYEDHTARGAARHPDTPAKPDTPAPPVKPAKPARRTRTRRVYRWSAKLAAEVAAAHPSQPPKPATPAKPVVTSPVVAAKPAQPAPAPMPAPEPAKPVLAPPRPAPAPTPTPAPEPVVAAPAPKPAPQAAPARKPGEFKVGDDVTFTHRAKGRLCAVKGQVVAVVPSRENPMRVFTQLRWATPCRFNPQIAPRGKESYLVYCHEKQGVGMYFPFVGDMHLAGGPDPARTVAPEKPAVAPVPAPAQAAARVVQAVYPAVKAESTPKGSDGCIDTVALYSLGLGVRNLRVCARASLSQDDVLRLAFEHYPHSQGLQWTVKDAPYPGWTTNPVVCPSYPTRRHWLLYR